MRFDLGQRLQILVEGITESSASVKGTSKIWVESGRTDDFTAVDSKYSITDRGMILLANEFNWSAESAKKKSVACDYFKATLWLCLHYLCDYTSMVSVENVLIKL